MLSLFSVGLNGFEVGSLLLFLVLCFSQGACLLLFCVMLVLLTKNVVSTSMPTIDVCFHGYQKVVDAGALSPKEDGVWEWTLKETCGVTPMIIVSNSSTFQKVTVCVIVENL